MMYNCTESQPITKAITKIANINILQDKTIVRYCLEHKINIRTSYSSVTFWHHRSNSVFFEGLTLVEPVVLERFSFTSPGLATSMTDDDFDKEVPTAAWLLYKYEHRARKK